MVRTTHGRETSNSREARDSEGIKTEPAHDRVVYQAFYPVLRFGKVDYVTGKDPL